MPVLVGTLAAVAVAVSGCAAGQQAQTVEQTSVVDGVGFQAGMVDLRDVGLRAPSGSSYAAGGNGYLQGVIINNARAEDELVSVTSNVADSVEIFANGVDAVSGLAPTPTATASSSSAGASDTSSASTGASASASSSPSSSESGATPSGAPGATGSVTSSESNSASSTPTSSATPSPSRPTPLTTLRLGTGTATRFGYDNSQVAIVLVGLKQQLFPAETFQITFTFANGGTATGTVSVKLPTDSTQTAPTIDTGKEGE